MTLFWGIHHSPNFSPQGERRSGVRTSRQYTTQFFLTVALFATTVFPGCAGYFVGHRTLYRPDIRTIHVPVFESESLRPHLAERLTEAVIREIQTRTPYRVVHTPGADSVLSGRIVQESKRVVAENRNDDARDIETAFLVEVRWIDRHGQLLMQQPGIPIPQLNVSVTRNVEFIPEAGQSLATAHQQTIERLAREIVGQMEIWW